MKKGALNSFLLVGIILSAFLPLVSAQYYGNDVISEGTNRLIDIVQQFTIPVFEVLLGSGYTEQFFLAKCLMIILVFVVVLVVLKKVPIFSDNKNVRVIVAIVISLLSMRFLPENDLINGILLPYSTLGVAILTFLPFLIYFYFIHESAIGGFGRRAGWVVYGIIFIALWYTKAGVELSDTSNYIYMIGLGLVILALIFDKSIHKYFAFSDFHRSERQISNAAYAKLMKDYEDAYELFMRHPKDKILQERFETLSKALHKNVGERSG